MGNKFCWRHLTKDIKNVAQRGCFLLLCLGAIEAASFADAEPLATVEELSHACLDQVSQGNYQTAVLTCQATLVAANATDPRLEGYAFGNLGTAYLHLREYQQAIGKYQQALTIASEIEDSALAVSALIALGSVYSQLEQPRQAIEFYQQAFDLAQTSDLMGAAIASYNLGLTYGQLNQLQQSLRYYRHSLKIALEIPDPLLEAYVWSKLPPTQTAQD